MTRSQAEKFKQWLDAVHSLEWQKNVRGYVEDKDYADRLWEDFLNSLEDK
jgi:hypothetical protein